MKKRVQVWMMALLMLLSTVAFSLLNAESVKADETGLTVKLHYLRSDAAYDDWDVWAWPKDANGAAYAFAETGDKGKIATISVPAGTTELGFIVRKGGDSWAGKEVGGDRFADLSAYTSGVVNIYVTADVKAFEVKQDDAAAGDNSGADNNAGANTETKEEPKDLTIQLNYLREDGNYEGWNIWGWYDGEAGKGFEFTETGDKGVVATITVKAGTPAFNFIVRQKQGDNDWAAKDVDKDRAVDLSAYTSGTVKVYLTSGVEEFEVKHEAPAADIPDTGDNSMIGLYLFVLVAGAAVVMTGAVSSKKRCR